jgi:nitrite reductase/ring-hydroxylating ferredoxin subunit
VISVEQWVRVCDDKSLGNGEMKEFDHGDMRIMVARAAGKVFATDRICTHAFADLTNGILNEDECTVTCPLHLSAFKLDSGAPQNPPAEEPLKTYKVKIQDAGIYVDIG